MWPRFEYILQLNIHSVRECDPNKLGHIDVRPHYVSERIVKHTSYLETTNATDKTQLKSTGGNRV